jgi:chromosome segregation ATPase
MKSGYYRYVEIIKETRGELRNALNNAKEANDKVKVLESELSQLEDRFERAQKVLEEM